MAVFPLLFFIVPAPSVHKNLPTQYNGQSGCQTLHFPAVLFNLRTQCSIDILNATLLTVQVIKTSGNPDSKCEGYKYADHNSNGKYLQGDILIITMYRKRDRRSLLVALLRLLCRRQLGSRPSTGLASLLPGRWRSSPG